MIVTELRLVLDAPPITDPKSTPAGRQQWLFPTNTASPNYWNDTDRALGTRLAVVDEALNGPLKTSWPLFNGYRTMRPGDIVWIYAGGEGALCAAATVDDVHTQADGTWTALWIWRRDITRALQVHELSRRTLAPFRFSKVVRGIRRVDPETAQVIDRWIDAAGPDPLGPDLGTDPSLSDDDNRRKREAIIAVRPGAARFRGDLMDAYGYRCAITGCDVEVALEAAHIKPYRGPRHDRVDNGILLRRDLHALFDANLLGIDETGRVFTMPASVTTPLTAGYTR
ncbi:HNH endonuclease [Nakamurella deserti]|uniref:HNH endonuclease n=1 Tax=Nakamurella deserti TaxID=2164074 RepID=UPI00197C8D05|nr:HNH endonuclease [Nakamurella deserti]